MSEITAMRILQVPFVAGSSPAHYRLTIGSLRDEAEKIGCGDARYPSESGLRAPRRKLCGRVVDFDDLKGATITQGAQLPRIGICGRWARWRGIWLVDDTQ